MSTQSFQTSDKDRQWYVINAENIILGRLATVAADLLRGKNKSTYTPNDDGGDNVVILNASKVILSTDKKFQSKLYFRHSGYPGGIKKETFSEAMTKHPEKVIFLAVKGMLQSNRISKNQLRRLRVYENSDHKHTQQLIEVKIPESAKKETEK